jgi:deoxyribodipyrimidine photo-lyase
MVYWMSHDPHGCASISRSIGGVHDTAWGDRPAFGKVRGMSLRGATSKFVVVECVRRNP